jgi:serine phosphatase RsbU (regulator of sigma subunit)
MTGSGLSFWNGALDYRRMADGVLRDVARFRQTSPPSDDMTLLIVRRRR